MKKFFVRFKENWLSVTIAFIIIVSCIIIIDLFHLYPNGAELNNVQTGSIHWITIVIVTIIASALFIIAKLKKNKLYELLKRASIYVFITIVFLILSFFVFTTNRWSTFDTTLPIDTDKWGHFGDFVGGTLGIILSLIGVVLVAWTFQTQNKTAETQRFNDLFFELLHLYQSEVKELNGKNERIVGVKKKKNEEKKFTIETEQIQYTDKDFFDEEKKKIQDRYQHLTAYEDNIQKAINYYMEFYVKNRSKMAAYFRTLYRIFELIDKTDLIGEQHKKEYAKIIRAQLTESELFFLRYDAMTFYGHQFIEYLNRYRVLKHLPAFELLEFKEWWKDMTDIEREGVNMTFHIICESLKDVFARGKSNSKYQVSLFPNSLKNKYHLTLTLTNMSDFRINMTIDNSIKNLSKECVGFLKLDETRIQKLFDFFLKELFIYSNFKKYNKSDDIQAYSSPIITNGDIVEINSGIKNIKNEPLVFKYPTSYHSTK